MYFAGCIVFMLAGTGAPLAHVDREMIRMDEEARGMACVGGGGNGARGASSQMGPGNSVVVFLVPQPARKIIEATTNPRRVRLDGESGMG